MSSLRIRVGLTEIHYEGKAEISLADVRELLSFVYELVSDTSHLDESASEGTEKEHLPDTDNLSGLHVDTVSSRLKVSTGPELVVAACATLQIVNKMASVDRKTLLEEMKKATGHYNQNMSSNLTRYLSQLVASKTFNKVGGGGYSLTAAKRAEIGAILAE